MAAADIGINAILEQKYPNLAICEECYEFFMGDDAFAALYTHMRIKHHTQLQKRLGNPQLSSLMQAAGVHAAAAAAVAESSQLTYDHLQNEHLLQPRGTSSSPLGGTGGGGANDRLDMLAGADNSSAAAAVEDTHLSILRKLKRDTSPLPAPPSGLGVGAPNSIPNSLVDVYQQARYNDALRESAVGGGGGALKRPQMGGGAGTMGGRGSGSRKDRSKAARSSGAHGGNQLSQVFGSSAGAAAALGGTNTDLSTAAGVGGRPRTFSCDKCDKTYMSKVARRRHEQRIHEHRRPHPCRDCGRAFYAAQDLNYHVMSHHSGERPFPCMYCNKRFINTNQRRIHMNKMHMRHLASGGAAGASSTNTAVAAVGDVANAAAVVSSGSSHSNQQQQPQHQQKGASAGAIVNPGPPANLNSLTVNASGVAPSQVANNCL